jgi:hypothetical protein
MTHPPLQRKDNIASLSDNCPAYGNIDLNKPISENDRIEYGCLWHRLHPYKSGWWIHHYMGTVTVQ